MSNDAEKTLQQIEVLKKYLPDLDSYFKRGASEKMLTAFEALIGQRLPESLRTFYKIYNGEKKKFVGLIFGWQILSIR